MLSFNPHKENCTACTACASICPVHCISMHTDEEGFLYPIASTDDCIQCGLCETVCPSICRIPEETQTHLAFAATSKHQKIWQRSASGGIFSEICLHWGDDNTWFYGAIWNDLRVCHVGVKGFADLQKLCRSKYIESSLEAAFIEIKHHLDNNEKVLFCGTPCQVAGLRHFLQKDYPQLLLIDLICHGVGSPYVFETCVKQMEQQEKKPVKHYEFRAKRRIHETDYLSKLSFSDHSELYVVDDSYIQLFLKQHCLRPSCGKNCLYRNANRPGDITIADFKGLTNIFPHLKGEKKNYSSIISNNNKGEQVIESLKRDMDLWECTTDDIIRFNPLFAKQTWFSDKRDSFFTEYVASPLETIQKWTHPHIRFKITFRQNVFDILPIFVRKLILKLKHNE